LVFTTLTKEALPMVRYRTRDLSRLLPGTARSMRRMQKITGRSDDMIILRGVNLFPSQIEELVMAAPGLSPHWQIRLTRDGRMDEMTVQVEATADHADHASRAAAAAGLAEAIKGVIGVNAHVVVAGPGEVERSAGKARRVVDDRPTA
jgi:phenylacetate-CoA ligase